MIAGGESGRSARPMEVEWATEIRDQCLDAKVPFFFKQFGTLRSNPNPLPDRTAKENGGSTKGGRTLKGRVWGQFPAPRRHPALSPAFGS